MARFASIYRSCSPALVIAESSARQLVPRIEGLLGSECAAWMFLDSKDHAKFDSAAAASAVPARSAADFPALLQYTSGSTGSPKGVVISHANLLSNSRCLEHVMAPLGPHLGFSWLPPYHDMGLMGALLLSVYSGFTLHMMSPGHFIQRPLRWLQAISHFGITTTVGPNFALEHCVDGITDEEAAALDLHRLKLLFCGAEPVRSATLERFTKKFAAAGFDRRAFLPCYGMAEATLFVSGAASSQARAVELHCDVAALAAGSLLAAAPDSPGARMVSCGATAVGHDVAIVDPATGLRLPERQVGEIWVSGPNVAQGYFQDPSATQTAFAGELADAPGRNYLRTGDLGALADGELFITGRIKEVINFAGRNLYPQDIETTVLGLHAGFRANGIAAFAVEESGAERLVVVAELSRGSRLTEAELSSLRRAIVEAVATGHGAAPHDTLIVLPASIPLTTSGKIQRSGCRDHYRRGDFHKRLMSASTRRVAAAGVESVVAT